MKLFVLNVAALMMLILPVQNVSAFEVLSAKELTSYCKSYSSESSSPEGDFCSRYIQGFIDGAVATDSRVMLNMELGYKRISIMDRARRTPLPGRDEYFRAARYAKFCLGNPIPFKEVISTVAKDLVKDENLHPTEAAREVVYISLKKHYPCDGEK